MTRIMTRPLAAILEVSGSGDRVPEHEPAGIHGQFRFRLIGLDGCSGSACVPAAAVSFPVSAQTHTHTHTVLLIDPSARSTLQQADTDSNQMFRRRTQRERSSPSDSLIGWHLAQPGRQSHLHARQIWRFTGRREGGVIFISFSVFCLTFIFGLWRSRRLFGESSDHKHHKKLNEPI